MPPEGCQDSEPQLGRGLLRLHHLQQRSKSTVLKKWKGPRPVLVRLRPFFGTGVFRHCYIYKGIPWTCIGATPNTSQHRLPAGWLAQCLNTNPDDLEAADVAVQAVRVPESHTKWLEDWGGSAVCPAPTQRRTATSPDDAAQAMPAPS